MSKKKSVLDGRSVPLYRAGLNCKIGRDAIEGKNRPPDGVQPLEYAVFCLLHAVEDLAVGMEQLAGNLGKGAK